MVEVLDPLNPREDSSKTENSTNPTITLEVPGFSFGKCLSPIKELPSPMPTPIPSPIPFQRTQKSSQEELSSSSSSSGKSSSKAANLLNSRRSSFTSFCKKAAANAGRSRRGSSAASSNLLKSSLSTSDEEMIPMQELNPVEVPIIVTNVPIITITEYDESDENLPSPPSPRPKIQNQDSIPEIKIESPKEEKLKFKPPPLIIHNSNFLNFEENSQNVPKDATSKPDESLTHRIQIELGERRTQTPNEPETNQGTIKVQKFQIFSAFFILFTLTKFPIYAAS